MKRTVLPDRLQALLAKIPYVAIATVSAEGQPWNSPVVGRFDDDLNLYWVSWRKTQHSRNIADEPRIFVVVYDSQIPEGTGFGLYLQMRARALDTADAIVKAEKVYDTSFFEHRFDHPQFLGECPQRIYKAVPEKVWYNIDAKEQGHFIDTRRELTTSLSKG